VNYLEAGAKGYVPEESSLSEVVKAIHQVLAGQVVCTDKAAPFILARLAELEYKDRHLRQFESEILTFREREILELMARGFTNQQIGSRLSISVHTVKNHVHNILRKMQVGGRLQAVRGGYEKKWLKITSRGS
jgi:NarL family two-component system response regulator LiaR